ncbi:MAG: Rpn family recombination-promoting nuclease/putative transposase [Lachnospiraceae bacterium]|nr:Rpn family recombination-promoting nuclease/putative transposase [Lachnospiraceae bacterium]
MKQKKDQVLVRYIGKPERVADLVNVNCFHGEQIVRAEDLEVLSGESKQILKDKNGAVVTISRFRDVLRVVTAKHVFIIVGCENQMKVHYVMPVREMLYDALNYVEQVNQYKEQHKKDKDLVTADEFLSGMRKEDKIKPVITLLLYHGQRPWDGSVDLHGMMDFGPYEDLKEYVPNYKMNLIQVNAVKHPEAYQSDLREFFGVMKHASSLADLETYVKENKERLGSVEEDLVDTFSELLGERKRLKIVKDKQVKEGEQINMCKAFDELEERGIQKGMEKGIAKGIEEGMEKGIAQGKASLIAVVRAKVNKGMEPQEIAELLEMDLKETENIYNMIIQYPQKDDVAIAMEL